MFQKILDLLGFSVGTRTYKAVIIFAVATVLVALAGQLGLQDYVEHLKAIQALSGAGALAALRAAKK